MKRFHVHVSVANLEQSIGFYATLFAAPPTVQQADYAKWLLEDPRINFAISTYRQPVGVNHLGIQVDGDDELRGMHATLRTADARLVEEKDQACCYARSDKYWVTDPTGIAWETFHTLGSVRVQRLSVVDKALSNQYTPCTIVAPISAPVDHPQVMYERADQGAAC